MERHCAWCQKEGKPSFMGLSEPLDDPRRTHGMCPVHFQAVRAQVTITKHIRRWLAPVTAEIPNGQGHAETEATHSETAGSHGDANVNAPTLLEHH